MAKDGNRTYGVKLVRGPFVRLDPHPLACETADDLRALAPTLTAPKAADLFCGAGGLSLGLTEAGYDVVLAVDHDDEALETHRAHHPGLSVNWDLADPGVIEEVADLVKTCGIELVAGGPPCQPFSKAGRSMMRDLVRRGRRLQHDGRRDMWESFLTVVELARPRAVVMENVPDMALDRGMVILRTMVERLEAIGYSVEERVIDTWRFGVPQFRQRLILVALADGVEFAWPTEDTDRVTVDVAIGDLPVVEGGWRPDNGLGSDPVASGWAEYAGPKTDFQRRARAGVAAADSAKVFDHVTRPVREDDALAFAQMTHQTRYSDLAPELKRYRDDIFDDKYKRLDPNDVSRTITAHIAKDGYWYIHPFQDRTLTMREAARLQTFPDHVRFAGPPSASFRQIGNAVPVRLGFRIGHAIRSSLATNQTAEHTTKDVAERLANWFSEAPPVHVPWLATDSRWVAIQGELLWSRIADEHLGQAWGAIRTLLTPDDTLRALPLLRRVASAWKRDARCDQLLEAAEWFKGNPDVLAASASASDLAKAPHVTGSIADFACRVVPGETEDPVLAGYGVLRVAARFQGDAVDRQNKLTDGRLAIARMIGADERSHEAHLALIELANGLCSPQRPDCGHCPLVEWCVEAPERPVQAALAITSRGGRRTRETLPASAP
ncbi:MAG: DNA (cytosine-5-)-methyltransferase [Acidimicrobiales bacterium]|nr:DNA (cytosine-5-)-methyltransferase [Acidimicrobiales bacterium]